jgi:hypothetical protein
MLPQHLTYGLWQRKGSPRASRLSFDAFQPTGINVTPQLGHHTQRSSFEVDVLPSKAEDFALPHAKRNTEHPARLQAEPSCRFQKSASLIKAVRLDLAMRHRRRVDQQDGVGVNDLPPHRNVQRAPYVRVQPADAAR